MRVPLLLAGAFLLSLSSCFWIAPKVMAQQAGPPKVSPPVIAIQGAAAELVGQYLQAADAALKDPRMTAGQFFQLRAAADMLQRDNAMLQAAINNEAARVAAVQTLRSANGLLYRLPLSHDRHLQLNLAVQTLQAMVGLNTVAPTVYFLTK